MEGLISFSRGPTPTWRTEHIKMFTNKVPGTTKNIVKRQLHGTERSARGAKERGAGNSLGCSNGMPWTDMGAS